MEEDVYGETTKKITNAIAVNRMKSLFESPNTVSNIKTSDQSRYKGRVSAAKSSPAKGTTSLELCRKDSHSNQNGNVPVLPTKGTNNFKTLEKNVSEVKLHGGRSSNDLLKGSGVTQSDSSQNITSKVTSNSVSVANRRSNFNTTEKMATDSNIPPWKLELMKRKQKQNGDVVKSDDADKKEVEEKSPVTNKSEQENKDVNSNNVNPKRKSKLDIPDVFRSNDGGEPPIKPTPPSKPKPAVSPRGPNNALKSPTSPATDADKKTGTEKPVFTMGHFNKTPGATNIQDELAKKLKKREEKLSESTESSGDTTVDLNVNSVEKLQQKILKNSDNSEEINKIVNKRENSNVAMRVQEVSQKETTGTSFKSIAKRKSVKRKSLTRANDGAKFYVVNINSVQTTVTAPDLPEKLQISDLKRLREIIQQYKAALTELENAENEVSSGVTEGEDEIYEAIDEPMPPEPVIRTKPPSLSHATRTVSIIQPMTAEEEEEMEKIPGDDSDGELYDDTILDCALPPETDLPPPPEDLLKPPLPDVPPPRPVRKQPPLPPPSPVPSEKSQAQEFANGDDDTFDETTQDNDQEIYEPVGDDIDADISVSSEQEKSEEEVLSPQEKKKREKERKKQEKKLEQERKEELKRLKKNYKLDPYQLDDSQGEGTLKADNKPNRGNKLDIEAKQGDRVILLRLVDNPKGKWLVKKVDNGKVGYVDSSNVEVENQLIRNVMEGSYMNSVQQGGDQEEYVDVEAGEPPQEDDLYEAV